MAQALHEPVGRRHDPPSDEGGSPDDQRCQTQGRKRRVLILLVGS
jgi:hypothetical protein